MESAQRCWWAAAVAAGLLLVPACSVENATGSQPSSNDSSALATAPASASPSASVRAVGFNETYRTEDGVEVTIGMHEANLTLFQTSEDPNAKEGDPYVVFTSGIENGTKTRVDVILTTVVKYGPEATRAAQVESPDVREPVFNLDPGEAREYDFSYIIPREFREQVLMEMTVSLDPLRTAVFSGPITPA